MSVRPSFFAALGLLLAASLPAGALSPQTSTSPQAGGRGALPERFPRFFEQFRSDSTFQKSRIRDPYRYRYFESPYDDAGKRVERRPSADWRFHAPITDWGVVGSTRPKRVTFNGRARAAGVDPQADSVNVWVRYPESDAVNVRYIFEREAAAAPWFLVELDNSAL